LGPHPRHHGTAGLPGHGLRCGRQRHRRTDVRRCPPLRAGTSPAPPGSHSPGSAPYTRSVGPAASHRAARREIGPHLVVREVVRLHRRERSMSMASPVVHFEIRSSDPDATRSFFGRLFGWTFPDGGIPGYSYVDTGVEGAIPGGISPLQGGAPVVTFFVGVRSEEHTS